MNPKGEYKVRNHFPVIRNLNNNIILDCNNITISGRGYETVIHNMGYWHEGKYHVEDVFNIVNCKNLTICNLSVTAEKKQSTPELDQSGKPIYSGTNAFSLINYVENIKIKNCRAFDMPAMWYYYADIDYYYPDGGKGFTIQHEGGDGLKHKGVHNVVFENCTVDNCASAFDVVINKNVSCNQVVWNNCTAKNCSYGVYVVNSKLNEATNISFNHLRVEDCQIGVYGYIPVGLTITDSYFYSNSNERKYPAHLTDSYFVQFFSAHNCTLNNNCFIKGKDITLENAIWLGQCGAANKYTTEGVSLMNNYFVGNFNGSVVKFIDPIKSNAVRFKNITTKNNSVEGKYKGKIIESPSRFDKTFVVE